MHPSHVRTWFGCFFIKLSKRFEIEKKRYKIYKYLINSKLYKWCKNMFYNMFFAVEIWILRSNFVPKSAKINSFIHILWKLYTHTKRFCSNQHVG